MPAVRYDPDLGAHIAARRELADADRELTTAIARLDQPTPEPVDVYDVAARPADGIWAVRQRTHPNDIWERSRVDPHKWYCARSGQTRTWRALVAEHGPLVPHYFDLTVWAVRADAEVPWQVHGLYSTEAAAVGAQTAGTQIQPWAVAHRPPTDGLNGT